MKANAYLTLALLAALLVACSGGGGGEELPWSEEFSEPGAWQAETDAAADVVIQEGVLRVYVAFANQLAWATAEKDLGDFHLAVDATQVAGPDDNEYGVLVRLQDAANFYRFSISGDGYFQVSKFEDGEPTYLGGRWMPSDLINQGQATNVIEVICQGSTFTFLVNGQQLAQVEDATFAHGDIGLYVGTFSMPGAEVHFDNLHVAAP
ncbi:MAG: DUF1080 domain-containing protein [Anaerolineae bacterium]|nr:DUF1080 domain-containing protein [Anaerolineae bacterium]